MKSPKIRFKEFQNEWNSRILGDFNIEMLKGSGISKNDLNNNGKNPCIHYGELFTYYKEFITEIKSNSILIGTKAYTYYSAFDMFEFLDGTSFGIKK